MELFLETWSTAPIGGEVKLFLPLGVVVSLVLGWLSYTDLLQNKSVPNTGSMGLLFVSLAVFSFIYPDAQEHIFWALGLSAFFLVIFLIGAVADGDMKLYLAFSWFLGPAALLAALLSWIIVFLYSLPIIFRTLKSKEKKKPGQRLGVAPAVPAIALSLPLTLALLGLETKYVAGMLLVMIFAFFASWALYVFDQKATEKELSQED